MLIADSFGILALFQALIADNFGIFNTLEKNKHTPGLETMNSGINSRQCWARAIFFILRHRDVLHLLNRCATATQQRFSAKLTPHLRGKIAQLSRIFKFF